MTVLDLSAPPPDSSAVETVHALSVLNATKLIRVAGRDPQVVSFEIAVISFFVDAAELLGVPKSVAAIYGICFASPEAIGFSEIQERLEISAGSISQGLRVLRDVGALRVSTSSLDKRDRFEPDLELRKLVARFVRQRLEQQLASGRGSLQCMLKRLPPGDASAKTLKQRVKSLQAWHDKARAVLPVLKTLLRLT